MILSESVQKLNDLCDSSYMTFWKRHISRDNIKVSGFQGLGEGGELWISEAQKILWDREI